MDSAARCRCLAILWTNGKCAMSRHFFKPPHEASLEEKTPLVAVKPTGTKTPMFMVPGPWTPLDYESEDAQFFFYVQLFHLIGEDRPIYGLRTLGLSGRLKTYRSVEHLASEYASIVQSVQPHGPYLLAGDCFSGSFAYEIGRSLSLRSQPVKLILFDACFPNKAYKKLVADGFRRERIRRWTRTQLRRLKKLISIPFSAKRNYKKAIDDAYRSISSAIQYSRSHERLSEQLFTAEKKLLLDIFVRYDPKPCDAKIALLMTDEYMAFHLHREWEKVAKGGFELHNIPGSHGSYCNQSVKTTAAIIHRLADGSCQEP
jgi:thioesterase domain-containing protein